MATGAARQIARSASKGPDLVVTDRIRRWRHAGVLVKELALRLGGVERSEALRARPESTSDLIERVTHRGTPPVWSRLPRATKSHFCAVLVLVVSQTCCSRWPALVLFATAKQRPVSPLRIRKRFATPVDCSDQNCESLVEVPW